MVVFRPPEPISPCEAKDLLTLFAFSIQRREGGKTGRKILALGAVVLFVTTMALAGVVNYLSNTVQTEVTVDSPIYLDGTHFQFDIQYGGEYDYALIRGENKASVPIEGVLKIEVEKNVDDEWIPVTDGGFTIAVTDDIQYYFETASVGTTWEEWMQTHWDWLDWYTNGDDLVKYPMTEEIQTMYTPMYDDVPVGTSCYTLAPWYANTEMFDPDLTDIDNNPDIVPKLFKYENTYYSPKTLIEPGKFFLLVKFCTEPNIEPGTYRISVTVVPDMTAPVVEQS